MGLTLFRILKFAVQDFVRNFWLSLVTITVLLLALFSVNILIGLNAVSDAVIQSVEEKVDINILLVKEATDADVDNFETFLSNIDGISSIEYLSADEVYDEFRESSKDKPDVQAALEEVTENPFNDTFVIQAEETSNYSQIIQDIQSSEYEQLVDNKDFADPQKIIAYVENVTDKVERFGVLLTLIFAVIAFLIVFNTIRVTIYTHKDEIGVMRLVGATNWFIRTPYLIEGVLYALIALGLNILLLYTVLNVIQPYMVAFLENYGLDLVAYFNANFVPIFGLELLIIILLNVISSGFAIRRYLKV
jgi:cell division transport system permease protein